MATVRIYLDKRAAKGEAPLKLSINHNSQSSFIPLNVRILPEQWKRRLQRVVNHPNDKRINLLLDGRKTAAERVILALSESGRINGMDAREIRDEIWQTLNPERRKKETFYARLIRYAELQKKQNTKDLFLWTAKKLQAFDHDIKRKSFDDITTDYLKELNSFYSHLGVNTRGILFRDIRTVFNDAIDSKITSNYPFRSFRIKTEPTKKKALSLEQIRLLSQVDNEYADMFMLMFYLRGINIGDLLAAKKDQIVNGRFEYRRSKVGTLFSIKLEPEALELIEKHKGKRYLLSPLDRYKDYKDYLHHLNSGLKKIGSKRGKNRKIESDGLFPGLSSNWARHTWITIGISLDIPKETISRGAGHGEKSVTDIYIAFDMKKVDEANRKIIDAVCG